MKFGYCSIIGKPNVGKSTLLNSLLATKISIVSSRPQTTRYRIMGILTETNCQCCFLDTPGIITPHYELQKFMIQQLKTAIRDADLIVWMVDPWFRKDEIFNNFLKKFKGKPIISVINKIDLVSKSELLPIIDCIKDLRIKEIIPISALTGEGIQDLKKAIFRYLPEGLFLYPLEDISARPERFFVAELIREKIFEHFKKEIPYATCVIIEEFRERARGKNYIRATIWVEKKSQKAILIGARGKALKEVGEAARKEIEKFLGRAVYLDLWVKVKEKWRKNKRLLKEIGY